MIPEIVLWPPQVCMACALMHTRVRVHTHTYSHITKSKRREGRKREKKEKVTLAKRKMSSFLPSGRVDRRREGGTEDGWMKGRRKGWRIDAGVWTLTF